MLQFWLNRPHFELSFPKSWLKISGTGTVLDAHCRQFRECHRTCGSIIVSNGYAV